MAYKVLFRSDAGSHKDGILCTQHLQINANARGDCCSLRLEAILVGSHTLGNGDGCNTCWVAGVVVGGNGDGGVLS